MRLLEEPAAPATVAAKPAPKITDDPLHANIQRNLNDLDEARARLVSQLRQLEDMERTSQATQSELAGLDDKLRRLDQERQITTTLIKDEESRARLAHLSLDELRQRGRKLLEDIKEVEKRPVQKRFLRYHTPVSRTVRGDELFFECKGGKVTFIDLQAFLHEMQAGGDGVAEELRKRAKVERLSSQIGAFRLRYF